MSPFVLITERVDRALICRLSFFNLSFFNLSFFNAVLRLQPQGLHIVYRIYLSSLFDISLSFALIYCEKKASRSLRGRKGDNA